MSMRNYIAFAGKEIIEGIRTYKSIILLAVFLIFGIMNPLFAKLTPVIISSFAGEGISISVPDPTAIDSWIQFFKNNSQLGFIVVVLLFSGVLASEVSRGTLINMLTKGLSRTTVILAKYSVMVLLWTLAYVLCLLVTLAYTVYLFPDNNASNLPFAVFALWLFGVLLISVLMLAASGLKSSYSCLLAVGAFVVVLMLIGIAPAVHDFNPMSLASDSVALMTEAIDPESLIPAVAVSVAGSIACLVGAILIFRKRQL